MIDSTCDKIFIQSDLKLLTSVNPIQVHLLLSPLLKKFKHDGTKAKAKDHSNHRRRHHRSNSSPNSLQPRQPNHPRVRSRQTRRRRTHQLQISHPLARWRWIRHEHEMGPRLSILPSRHASIPRNHSPMDDEGYCTRMEGQVCSS